MLASFFSHLTEDHHAPDLTAPPVGCQSLLNLLCTQNKHCCSHIECMYMHDLTVNKLTVSTALAFFFIRGKAMTSKTRWKPFAYYTDFTLHDRVYNHSYISVFKRKHLDVKNKINLTSIFLHCSFFYFIPEVTLYYIILIYAINRLTALILH